MRKLLLVEPPFYRLFKNTYALDRYPLALGYLAAVVRRITDWRARAYNADFQPRSEPIRVSYLTERGFTDYLNSLGDLSMPIWNEVANVVRDEQPDVLGISAKSQNFASARNVARIAKQINPGIKVVVGGPHPSMVGAEVLRCGDIDVAVRGEGERTLVEVLNVLQTGGSLAGVNGICYRSAAGECVETPPRELLRDLDTLPFPHEVAAEVLRDYSAHPPEAFGFVFSSRGCPRDCFFCGSREIWSRRVRLRSPDNIIQEIQRLQQHGVRAVDFVDDIFGVHSSHLKEVCRGLREQCPGLIWSCETHPAFVEDETVAVMASSGCRAIRLGVESGNNAILKAMRRGYTIEQALAACRTIKRHGIYLSVFFIVGFPQETEDTLRDTVRAIRETRSDHVCYSIFTPYPGTEAFQVCKERGLIRDDFDVALYNHQSPANCFCLHLSRDRFRSIVGILERQVDRKNRVNRIRSAFSWRNLRRLREVGLKRGLRMALGILRGAR